MKLLLNECKEKEKHWEAAVNRNIFIRFSRASLDVFNCKKFLLFETEWKKISIIIKRKQQQTINHIVNTNFYRQQTSRSIGENIERELKSINNNFFFCQNTDKKYLTQTIDYWKRYFLKEWRFCWREHEWCEVSTSGIDTDQKLHKYTWLSNNQLWWMKKMFWKKIFRDTKVWERAESGEFDGEIFWSLWWTFWCFEKAH